MHKEYAHADIRMFTYVWPIKEIECHSAFVQLGRKCRKLSFAVFVGGQDVSAVRHRLRLRRIVASSQDNTPPGEGTLTPSWALCDSLDKSERSSYLHHPGWAAGPTGTLWKVSV